MIGLSLSFCVRNIADGKIAEADVEEIIASTNFANREDWQTVLNDYVELYWHDNLKQCRAIAQRLWKAMRIDQPRRRNDPIPDIRCGHWVTDRAQILYYKE